MAVHFGCDSRATRPLMLSHPRPSLPVHALTMGADTRVSGHMPCPTVCAVGGASRPRVHGQWARAAEKTPPKQHDDGDNYPTNRWQPLRPRNRPLRDGVPVSGVAGAEALAVSAGRGGEGGRTR